MSEAVEGQEFDEYILACKDHSLRRAYCYAKNPDDPQSRCMDEHKTEVSCFAPLVCPASWGPYMECFKRNVLKNPRVMCQKEELRLMECANKRYPRFKARREVLLAEESQKMIELAEQDIKEDMELLERVRREVGLSGPGGR